VEAETKPRVPRPPVMRKTPGRIPGGEEEEEELE
jgi:hypothetical protein